MQTYEILGKIAYYIAMLIAMLLYITEFMVVVAGPSAASNAEVAANENEIGQFFLQS